MKFELEEAKFEDSTFLQSYFKEMRNQIEQDFENIN